MLQRLFLCHISASCQWSPADPSRDEQCQEVQKGKLSHPSANFDVAYSLQ